MGQECGISGLGAGPTGIGFGAKPKR